LRDKEARKRANAIREFKRNRLFQHIRDNILYYCRAIWAHEDQDQRLLRYKKEGRRVPIEWQAEVPPAIGVTPSVMEFSPTGLTVPLWELIDPTGPIGYAGNYAVFGLRPLPNRNDDVEIHISDGAPFHFRWLVSLNFVLNEMRRPYLGDKNTCAGKYEGKFLDPALRGFCNQVQGKTFEKLKDDEVWDLASYLPRLEEKLFETDTEGNIVLDARGQPRILRNTNNDLQKPPIAEDYAEYLYRKNGTRRFLVDSNNLYLSIRTSEGAALEPFKRAHRYIDVLKAYEELGSMELKNRRRATHINQANEYDPDIEKVIIVGDGASSLAASHAALHATMGTTPPTPSSPMTAPVVPDVTPETTSTSSDGGTTSNSGGGGTS
jgi:hypothetical protein